MAEIICGMLFEEQNYASGLYNVNAPENVTNTELTAALARSFGMPYLLPNVPQFALKLMVGDVMADMICGGSRISSEKLQSTGFKFKYPTVESCLNDLAKKD